MKRLPRLLITSALLTPVFGEVAKDNFDTGHTNGSPPAGWDTMFDPDPTNLPLQQGLFTVEAAVGRYGSRGLSLDVSKAKAAYLTKFKSPRSGPDLILSAEFQITTSGIDLDKTGTPNGINDPIIGLMVSTAPEWDSGRIFSISFARREDDFLGMRIPAPPFVEGYFDNSAIGLEAGLVPSSSDWFTMTMFLTDTGASWEASLKVFKDQPDAPLYASATLALHPDFVSGAPIYGGLFTGYSPEDAPLGEVSKLTALSVDNVVFGPPALQLTAVSVGPYQSHTFTSVAGKTHHLQYSTDGIHFYNTGSSREGDGSVQALGDRAPDPTGRTYRVTSE